MTVDELSREVRTRDLQIMERISDVQADVAAIRAVVDEHNDQREKETGALFDVRKTHEERINKLEREYTPRADFSAAVIRLSTVEAAIARSAGVGWAIQAVITLLGMGGIAALIKWGGGH